MSVQVTRLNVITYGDGGVYVLSKNYSLGFNDEEVDELFDVLEAALKVFAWQRVVLAGAHLCSQTTIEDHSSGNLRGSNN